MVRRSNAERTEKARADILSAARILFGQNGFSATSTPMIAEAAGVSRGALYHHFADKTEMFRAVAEAEFRRIEASIDTDTDAVNDPLERLIEGGDNFISAMLEPIARRILLVEGPAVLGSEEMRQLDNRTTEQSLREGILAAQSAGRLPRDLSAEAMTSLMSGAFDRAVIDGHSDDEDDRQALREVIRALWFGLSRIA